MAAWAGRRVLALFFDMTRSRTRKPLMLAAWFQEHEVRQFLTVRAVHSASEIDDLLGHYTEARRLFDAAPPWESIESVEIRNAPANVIQAFKEREGQAVQRGWFDALPHEVVVVSLAELRAFQFTVDRPYAGSFRVHPHATVEDLAAMTLPSQPVGFPLQISTDNMGLTVSAPGPNLRVQGMSLEGSPDGRTRLTVDLTFGSPLMQVAEFQGRFLLKNGYHRAVGLLSQEITHVPVLLVHCSDYSQTGATGQGFFTPQIVQGPKPPLLKHFLSKFAIEFNATELHKAIRLRPDEFQLAVPE